MEEVRGLETSGHAFARIVQEKRLALGTHHT
jgi:hypothetical protein